ncbi:MAG: phosphoribosylamine--glycine ligase, partial [Desulfococcaceae bacterium]
QIKDFVLSQKIDLVTIGPEALLIDGLGDFFAEDPELKHILFFGPRKKGAMLEGSKDWAKHFMLRHNIPTAQSKTFTIDTLEEGKTFLNTKSGPYVLKADGLAAGKGVLIIENKTEAKKALEDMLKNQKFGEASAKVVVEDYLPGTELSVFVITDGIHYKILPEAKDYKRIGEGDTGLNTGGMGAISPVPFADNIFMEKVEQRIIKPTIQGLQTDNIPYCGFIFFGLMNVAGEPLVIEYNARMGDPEAQPLLMRIQSDLVPLLEAVIDGDLDRQRPKIDPRPAVCVVMAAGGYPGDYEKGHPIQGLDAADGRDDRMIFHAGTRADAEKGLVASGGRVLGVTALGDTIGNAIDAAYETVEKISWKDVHFRKDIGQKALRRMERQPRVLILLSGDSDLSVMEGAAGILKKFDVSYEMTVASAHQSPARAADLAANARGRGIRIVIAGAGKAAHLAGAIAAHTTLPVIGVPISSSALQGLDALLSTVQMPAETPVATMGLGRAGAVNAGLLAVQMLSLSDPDLERELEAHKAEMVDGINRKAAQLEQLV